jgi:hypothetical protein
MLKMFANIYSNTKEDFDVVAKSLEKDGYTIAYQFDNAGIVLKEVDALESENSES